MGRKKLFIPLVKMLYLVYRKKFLLFSFFLSSLLSLNIIFAENYRIAEVKYNIEGNTKQSAISRFAKIDAERIFTSKAELQLYAADLQQMLINTRLFSEALVEISFDEEALTEFSESPISVCITISVSDTKHFIMLPYPKYSSNDGYTLKLKIKDDNFFGTMSTMEGDLFFSLVQKSESDSLTPKFGGSFSFDLPFSIGIIQSKWLNRYQASYTIGKSMPEWNLATGMFFSLPLKNISLDLTLLQSFINDFEYERYGDATYFNENAKFEIPVTLEKIDGWGEIKYTPGVEYNHNWDFNKINRKNEDLFGSEITAFHYISTGRVNWNGNFRKGLTAKIEQDAAYNYGLNEFQPGFSGQLTAFYSWSKIGINTRLYAFGQFDSFKKFGQFLRGIRDDQYFAKRTGLDDIYAVKATSAIIFNLDIPIHLFYLNFKGRLSKFNMEIQISPFIDIALSDNRITKRFWDPQDGFYTCGIEFLAFPELWKSVQIRGSVGYDLSRSLFKDYIDSSWRSDVSKIEISVGIGLFY